MEERILQAIANSEQKLMKEINTIKEDVAILKEKVGKIEKQMDSIEARMDSMEKRMDSIEARMDSMENEHAEMRNELMKLPSIIGLSVEKIFCRLEYRIQKLIEADEEKQVELVMINKRLKRLEVANGILEPIF